MSTTSVTYPLLSRLIAAAVSVSQKSAKILRDVKKSGELNIQEKEKNDYVTKADFLSQLNIIKSLENLFPKLKFCGEEGELKEDYADIETTLNQDVLNQSKHLPDIYNSLKEEDLFVWVDPLDGTKEYTQGIDVAHEVTVLIGVAYNGKPIAGVVNQPFYKVKNNTEFHERVLWGIVGLGTFDLQMGKLTPQNHNKDSLRIVTTRSHITELVKKDLSNIPNSTVLHAGGAGYKSLMILDNKADCYLYPRNGTKRWDTCAPEALFRALGGTMTDIWNNEYSYLKNNDTLVENCNGIIFSLHKDNLHLTRYLSDELKNNVKHEAEKLKTKK